MNTLSKTEQREIRQEVRHLTRQILTMMLVFVAAILAWNGLWKVVRNHKTEQRRVENLDAR